MAGTVGRVPENDVGWLAPLCVWLALVALLIGVFIASLRNARAIKRDLDQRFHAVQARLERDANALADELLGREHDRAE